MHDARGAHRARRRTRRTRNPEAFSALSFSDVERGVTPSGGSKKVFGTVRPCSRLMVFQLADGWTVMRLEFVDSRGRSDRAARGKNCRRERSNRLENVFEIVREGSNRAGGANGSSGGTGRPSASGIWRARGTVRPCPIAFCEPREDGRRVPRGAWLTKEGGRPCSEPYREKTRRGRDARNRFCGVRRWGVVGRVRYTKE